MAERTGNALSAPASTVGNGTVWQVRVDRWSAIADLARRLADPTAPAPAQQERARELGELFELVSPLEHYWAVPGPERVAELRRLYTVGDYEALVAAVEPIARRMVGDFPPGERERPSFEVLLVRRAWEHDEFVLDPSRVTLYIGLTGVDGDTFKHEYLMERYGIQVNKTSRNTVLFMTSIGTTRSSVAYLIEVLVRLAQELEDEVERMGPLDRHAHERRVHALTGQPPPLPHFSAFHRRFRGDPEGRTPEGDIRAAFFLAYEEGSCEYMTGEEARRRLDEGREVVSATFVIPYPPGFPILVPGQVVSRDILTFMQALDTREVHGYVPGLGYRVFTEEALR